MEQNKFLLTLVILTIFSSSFSQEEKTKKIKKINLSNISIQAGTFSEYNRSSWSSSDFKQLAPQSVLLKKDFSGYTTEWFRKWPSNVNIFSMMLTFQFSDKQKTSYKTNPKLRLGIFFSSVDFVYGTMYKEERKTYDTLISTQSGETVYLDSVTNESYNIDYIYDQLSFDGSLIFRTNTQTSLSLYSGIGITGGMSINAQSIIVRHKVQSALINNPFNGNSSSYSYSGSESYEIEKHKNKTNIGISPYIPIGIDFNTGKKCECLKGIHFFYELRAGINIASIPELRTIVSPSVQHGFGIKVSLNELNESHSKKFLSRKKSKPNKNLPEEKKEKGKEEFNGF